MTADDLIFTLAVFGFIPGVLAACIAHAKNRPVVAWFLACFFISPLVIVLGFMRKLPATEAHKSEPIMTRATQSTLIGVLSLIAIAAILAAYRGDLPAAGPTKCSEFSVGEINRVWQNAPLIKLTGTQVLEIIKVRDTGSTGPRNLKCTIEVIVNTAGAGESTTLSVSMRDVNGKPYIFVEALN